MVSFVTTGKSTTDNVAKVEKIEVMEVATSTNQGRYV